MLVTVSFVAVAIALAWKSYQSLRAPHSLPLRWLTICLACTAIAYPLGSEYGVELLNGAFVVGAAKIVSDVLVMGMTFTILVFYLYSAGNSPSTRRRVRWETVGFVGATAVVLTAAFTAPDQGVLPSTFKGVDMTTPRVLTFYVGLGLYMIYTLSAAGFRTCRYARMSSGIEAAALWTATAGLAGTVAASAVRSGFTFVRAVGGTVPDRVTTASQWLLTASIPVFVFGVSWPGLRAGWAAGRLRFGHRRTYRKLEPLWSLLSSAYPDTVLPATGRRGAVRYVRQLIECRDGMIRIGPRLGVASDIEAMATEELAPEELALRLRRAVDDVHRGQAGPLRQAPLSVTKHTRTEAEEVRRLVAVSEALRLLPAGTR
jgi:hypothetical protein